MQKCFNKKSLVMRLMTKLFSLFSSKSVPFNTRPQIKQRLNVRESSFNTFKFHNLVRMSGVAAYDKDISDEEFNSGVLKLARNLNSYNLNRDDCQSKFVKFFVDDKHIGVIDRAHLPKLQAYDIFIVESDKVSMNPKFDTFEKKTEAMETALRDMKEKRLFKKLDGWRNEHYYVRTKFDEEPIFSIERSSVSIFGIRAYGCHINGYIKRGDEYFMWIARRSKTKQTYPGMLDNFVAGGLTAGLSLMECAKKELEEEAGLGEELAKSLKQVDVFSYAYIEKNLVTMEAEFVFDLRLPEDFVPQNTDGEVESFYLMNINQVKNAIISDEFKLNSAAITLNFLMRKGLVIADKVKSYCEVSENMHAPGL